MDSSNICVFPIKNTHQKTHQKMHDNLVNILVEMHELAKQNKIKCLPTDKNGAIEWHLVPVSFIIEWVTYQATKVDHIHE